jgi:hypothetical protein
VLYNRCDIFLEKASMGMRRVGKFLIPLSVAMAGTTAAQTSLADLDTDTRNVAMEAISIIDKEYYKAVDTTALVNACVTAAGADNGPSAQTQSKRCLGGIIGQLDDRSRFLALDDASLRPVEQAVSRPVHSELLQGEVLLITVPEMSDNASRQMDEALAAVEKRRVRGVILDLRGNEGGLLVSAAAVGALYLPARTSVATTLTGKARKQTVLEVDGAYRPLFPLGANQPMRQMPRFAQTVALAVLVDEKTAGAAEVLAAALQDHRRAIVIGRTTIGRVTVATVVSLSPDSAMKLTIGTITRASGAVLDGRGVTPDHIVAADKDMNTALAQFQ